MSDTYRDVYEDVYGGSMTRRMFDAAWPPEQPPKVDVVNRYIGGETPHVWTQAETDMAVAKSGATYVLPNFVRVPPTSQDPAAEAEWCLRWLADHRVPQGCTLALDYETAIDNTYLGKFDARMVAGGYRVMVYGTRRTVLQNNKPSGGYWTAHWTNVAHICSDPGVVATQYGGDTTLGQPWDINLVDDSVPLWNVTGDDMSAEDVKAINDHADKLYRLLAKPSDGRANLAGLMAALSSVTGEIDATQTAIANLQLAAVNPAELATALGPLLGADLADRVAAELSARLAQ